MARKINRIMVALVCKESGTQNYVTSVSKLNSDIIKTEVQKYCNGCRKHTMHKFSKKLD